MFSHLLFPSHPITTDWQASNFRTNGRGRPPRRHGREFRDGAGKSPVSAAEFSDVYRKFPDVRGKILEMGEEL
jgi:hypothetical protein